MRSIPPASPPRFFGSLLTLLSMSQHRRSMPRPGPLFGRSIAQRSFSASFLNRFREKCPQKGVVCGRFQSWFVSYFPFAPSSPVPPILKTPRRISLRRESCERSWIVVPQILPAGSMRAISEKDDVSDAEDPIPKRGPLAVLPPESSFDLQESSQIARAFALRGQGFSCKPTIPCDEFFEREETELFP